MKKCLKCGIVKSLDRFLKNQSPCKECRKKLQYKWIAENKEKYLKKRKEWFTKNPGKCKQYNQKNYHRHREERIEKSKAYAMENKEKIVKYSKEYHATPKNRLKRKIFQWENSEKLAAYKREWRKNNPEKSKAIDKNKHHRRKAGQKETDITYKYLIRLKEETRICPYCITLINEYHLDHKIPLSRGGRHEMGNIVYCCARCNMRKNNKTDLEYIQLLINFKTNVH